MAVMGGGICGAAIAWDAAQRGLSVALVERGDFGGSTSANSLKVVHGGIRYLQRLDVRRSGSGPGGEPGGSKSRPTSCSSSPSWSPHSAMPGAGRGALRGVFLAQPSHLRSQSRRLRPGARAPAARLISRAELLEWLPPTQAPRPSGAGVFSDQLYNPPRLVWEFIRTAARAGAVVGKPAGGGVVGAGRWAWRWSR